MRKTYTSSAVKARWNKRHYDRLTLIVKKGEREQIAEYAQSEGLTTNGLVNLVAREVMGIPEEDWKPLYVEPIE